VFSSDAPRIIHRDFDPHLSRHLYVKLRSYKPLHCIYSYHRQTFKVDQPLALASSHHPLALLSLASESNLRTRETSIARRNLPLPGLHYRSPWDTVQRISSEHFLTLLPSNPNCSTCDTQSKRKYGVAPPRSSPHQSSVPAHLPIVASTSSRGDSVNTDFEIRCLGGGKCMVDG
jgi:hypothetical protein